MSTASASQDPAMHAEPVTADVGFDPDSFRMTVGEHLEELRTRLLFALGGLIVAVLGCLLFSEKVMVFFCRPLNNSLAANHLPQTMFFANLTDPFMTYLKVTMISAGAIAGPWIIFQIWQFVAAGLYPNERQAVTRYIPLSVGLFILGVAFVYWPVLPLSINFFIKFAGGLTPHAYYSEVIKIAPSPTIFTVPVISGNPESATPGAMWIDSITNTLKVAVQEPTNHQNEMTVRRITLEPESMMMPIITIGDYIDLVFTFMLTFGIAFQLPLVMLALVGVGVVDLDFLKKKRKVMFFGMTVAAGFLAPGDIITSMLALLIPLVILYEFGLILVKLGERRKAAENATGN